MSVSEIMFQNDDDRMEADKEIEMEDGFDEQELINMSPSSTTAHSYVDEKSLQAMAAKLNALNVHGGGNGSSTAGSVNTGFGGSLDGSGSPGSFHGIGSPHESLHSSPAKSRIASSNTLKSLVDPSLSPKSSHSTTAHAAAAIAAPHPSLDMASQSPHTYGSFQKQYAQGTFHQEGHKEDPDVFRELNTMYSKVQSCIDTRHKYQSISLQRESDNPKNSSEWEIYPPPPKPSWKPQTKEFAATVFEEDENERANENDGVEDGEADDHVNEHVTNGTNPPSRRPRLSRIGSKLEVGDDFDMANCPIPTPSEYIFAADDDSVFQVYESQEALDQGLPIVDVPTLRDYYMDMDRIISISSDGPVKSFAFRRLQYLEAKWNLYSLLNEYQETADSKKTPHRDFYNVRKVDTHVHHSACMNQKHLLRFIKYKMKKFPNEVVIYRDNKLLTLTQVFDSLGLTAYDLSIDTLDMHAHKDSFHRFDKFNLKYNPIGESRLREIFLKTDNYIKGRYLAEITKEVVEDLEQSKYQMAEYRISIYGRDPNEWSKLAAWVIDNKLLSHNVRWLIQIPRLYNIYKEGGIVKNFNDVVENVFKPLFEVTKDPSKDPKLHVFLQRVIGFDSVDDESKVDRRFHKKYPTPKYWDNAQNPPYSYYLYYLYANMSSLNAWRKKLGYNTFVLRPHAGEAGDPEHLVAAFLTSHSISHGILLRKVPFIQYLYYLDQIGIAMSPLSNNALFLNYDKNPFHSYFKRGLNVSLSTDDPLQFSYTREPLIEEYSVAAQIYKLSNVDMCELARNSVIQSGFEAALKKHWIGKTYTLRGPKGNVMEKTNVPNVRLAYREETFLHEVGLIERYTGISSCLRNER
ncbi:AMP deaminase [Sugiyamaella lignohabitans]|uniref:AMP deaminase n=1 Tax=Sugiyamaella lignohabitans TaxID=796027 RepID=A0A167F162_9ASCO|nr:AMP deaminase [Sugiyamaella lignohabitans]ANB14693.1 AMP deaminase [Sugiyamaella lignohabitans]